MAKSVITKVKDHFRLKRGEYKDINEMFHHRYYKKMFNKYIQVCLANGDIIKGGFNAELPEIDSVKIGSRIIKIEDIELIRLLED